jgi:predicted DNA-binding transcriptional regulator YafY
MPLSKKQLLRLFYLVSELKANNYPNCSTVAMYMRRADLEDNQNLCCSTKTIFRDIQTLKNDFGAPIDFDKHNNGYRLTDRTWEFLLLPLPSMGKQVRDVRIKCSRDLISFIEIQKIHSSQIIKQKSEVYIPVISETYILSWIMNHHGQASLISPLSLRQKVEAYAKDIMLAHSSL